MKINLSYLQTTVEGGPYETVNVRVKKIGSAADLHESSVKTIFVSITGPPAKRNIKTCIKPCI